MTATVRMGEIEIISPDTCRYCNEKAVLLVYERDIHQINLVTLCVHGHIMIDEETTEDPKRGYQLLHTLGQKS